MTGHTSTDLMCAITLHQPWASLIALGLKTVETRSWPAPARLVAQRIAIHAGKRVVRQPGDAIERELRARLGEDWRLTMPTGAVLATAVLAGMTQVADMDLRAGYVVHDLSTEVGCAVGTRRTPLYPWGGFSSGRWLWFLTDVDTLPEPAPTVSAANPFGSGAPVIAVGNPHRCFNLVVHQSVTAACDWLRNIRVWTSSGWWPAKGRARLHHSTKFLRSNGFHALQSAEGVAPALE